MTQTVTVRDPLAGGAPARTTILARPVGRPRRGAAHASTGAAGPAGHALEGARTGRPGGVRPSVAIDSPNLGRELGGRDDSGQKLGA